MNTMVSNAHIEISSNTLAYVTNQSTNGTGYELFFERNTLIDVSNFFFRTMISTFAVKIASSGLNSS